MALLLGLIPTWGCLLVGVFNLLRPRPAAARRARADPVEATPAEQQQGPFLLSYATADAGMTSRSTLALLWLAAVYPLGLSAMMFGCALAAKAELGHWPADARDDPKQLKVGDAVMATGCGVMSCGLVQVLVLAVGGGVLLRHPCNRSAAGALVVFAAGSFLCVFVDNRLDFLTWMID